VGGESDWEAAHESGMMIVAAGVRKSLKVLHCESAPHIDFLLIFMINKTFFGRLAD
jgi:hypothetical protein